LDYIERFNIVKRNTVEIVTEEELLEAFRGGRKLKGYLGFEPSGIFHIGWLVWAYKFRDLVDAGVEMYLLAATWHAWINDKLGGDMELIRAAANHVFKVLEVIGVNLARTKFVYAEELVSRVEYWEKVLRIAKSSTLQRVRRALTIMGRRADEAEMDISKLIYPLMQVADIFELDLDIALGGIDQRKAHMLARDVAEKLGFKKPIAIHTQLIPSLSGTGRMDLKGLDIDELAAETKMSKSKPESAIFVTDTDEEIARKIRAAYCPPRAIEGNPVIAIARYIIFADPKKKLKIERKPEHGGDIEITSPEELEKLYSEGKIHPLDLKNAVAEELIRIVKPIRSELLSDPRLREELEKIRSHISR